MSDRATVQTQTSSMPSITPIASEMLQRACACGHHTPAGGECENCKEKRAGMLQRAAINSSPGNGAPPIVHEVLRSPGQPLDAETRAFMEPRFGHDFSGVHANTDTHIAHAALSIVPPTDRSEHEAEHVAETMTQAAGPALGIKHDFSHVRVHTGAQAATSARAIGARAYTVGQDIVFGTGHYAPGTGVGQRLLAHELTHVAQQGRALSMQRDQDDPVRFRTVHENLFVNAPSGGALIPWQDANPTGQGSASTIITQFKDNLRALIADRPGSVGGTVATRTTESEAETDAIAVDLEIRTRFPQIAASASEATLRSAVGILSPTQTSSSDFVRQWLINRLSMWTNIDDYDIRESDTRYQQLLTDLLADSYVGPHILTLMSRQSAFTEGEGSARRVFLHRGITAAARRPILIHELTHFYVHQGFKDWVAETNAPRVYEEGFTEYLARKVMVPDELARRNSYGDHVQKVNDQVARYIPEDDMARAYFLGEVWRIETQSDVSRQLFESQAGMRAAAPHREEVAQSRSAPGITQTVAAGMRYRFMNLGNNQSTPKSEHVTFFQAIYSRYVASNPSARLRFVGHASSPGSPSHNLEISRRRAAAFYQMARDAGVPEHQLLDANNPPHEGETTPTAENEDVQGRAFNRRVELFITQAGAP